MCLFLQTDILQCLHSFNVVKLMYHQHGLGDMVTCLIRSSIMDVLVKGVPRIDAGNSIKNVLFIYFFTRQTFLIIHVYL